ncbi:hypothetical protein ACIQF6_19830 [Kitasatospora sp. NPDC092948]|uniref:hypothetical protein n=1 Tax=Kitasatospora sp. NPDC092948 TaxID=3364088 RepID=UPI003826757D
MTNPIGTYDLRGATLHVFADPRDDSLYNLEVVCDGETVRYDGGHSAREVQAFIGLFT